ncbi:MAG: glycogen debranching enzyme GlgX [Comamonadaceae bacterium]|nr:MAG: glycogen debranching enzyme GlgX [Comamonadaceae bacterium]
MLSPGLPHPLGATVLPDGVNFALAAPNATRVELCLFDSATGREEQQRLPLPGCTDGVWHGLFPGARAGLVYGWRVHGPWAPNEGHRFNPAKVLLDPYAREIVGRYGGEDLFVGHDAADPRRPDLRDSAALALKARVASLAPRPTHRPGKALPPGRRVLYELHVRGHTQRHPEVPPELRGSFAGLAHPAVLDPLQRLGVTTLSLLPVQHRADEQRLLAMGLSNYWGYNTIGWFAPEARYWSGRAGTTPSGEFRAMADAIHARGMELVIDVVYNHSAETDELGPTLSLRGIDNALYYQLDPADRSRYVNWSGCGNCLDFSQPRVVQLAMDSLRHWVGELGVDGFRFDLAPVLGRRSADRGGEFDPRAPFFAAVAQDPLLARALLIAEPWDIGPDGHRLGRFPPGWLEWNDGFRDAQRGFWLGHGARRGEFAHRFAASSGEFRHDARAPTASVNFVTAHDGFTLRDLVSYDERHNHANGEHNRDGSSRNLSRNFGVEGETDRPEVRAARQRRQRALLAALLLSQGTPMLLAGDEIGRSQRGNNNAYCLDDETTWTDWAAADHRLAGYVERLAALRREAEPLRSERWWPDASASEGARLRWLRPDAAPMAAADWDAADPSALSILFETALPASAEPAAGRSPAAPGLAPMSVAGAASRTADWLLLVNPQDRPEIFSLPGSGWQLVLASDVDSDPVDGPRPLPASVELPPGCLWVARR